jgi:hypothetical protein
MKMEPQIIRRIVRNALISLFIYALPVFAMFLVFYLRGERPWMDKKQHAEQIAPRDSRR